MHEMMMMSINALRVEIAIFSSLLFRLRQVRHFDCFAMHDACRIADQCAIGWNHHISLKVYKIHVQVQENHYF